MKSKLIFGAIGYTLWMLLTPNALNALGRDFGTNRQPRTCTSTSAPRTGSISAKQAAIYVACDAEGDRKVKMGGTEYFIDILNLQVNPKPRQVDLVDVQRYGSTIDRDKPIYDIKGSVVAYSCYNLLGGLYKRGQNCTVARGSQSVGACYKNPFGNWRCDISVSSEKRETNMPPPN
jgi:hypothetical protein